MAIELSSTPAKDRASILRFRVSHSVKEAKQILIVVGILAVVGVVLPFCPEPAVFGSVIIGVLILPMLGTAVLQYRDALSVYEFYDDGLVWKRGDSERFIPWQEFSGFRRSYFQRYRKANELLLFQTKEREKIKVRDDYFAGTEKAKQYEQLSEFIHKHFVQAFAKRLESGEAIPWQAGLDISRKGLQTPKGFVPWTAVKQVDEYFHIETELGTFKCRKFEDWNYSVMHLLVKGMVSRAQKRATKTGDEVTQEQENGTGKRDRSNK